MNILKFRIILHVGIFNKYEIQFARAFAVSKLLLEEQKECVNVLKSRKLHAYSHTLSHIFICLRKRCPWILQCEFVKVIQIGCWIINLTCHAKYNTENSLNWQIATIYWSTLFPFLEQLALSHSSTFAFVAGNCDEPRSQSIFAFIWTEYSISVFRLWIQFWIFFPIDSIFCTMASIFPSFCLFLLFAKQ